MRVNVTINFSIAPVPDTTSHVSEAQPRRTLLQLSPAQVAFALSLTRFRQNPVNSTLRRCAFLTLHDPTGYEIDDHLAIEPLRALGWEVATIPWNQPEVDWAQFEVVVIRSPWDYQHHVDEFLRRLAHIASVTRLENPLELVRWNLDKRYLQELERRGVPTVPTVWRDRLATGELERVWRAVNAEEIVVKPVVGAGATGAFRLAKSTWRERASEVERYYAQRGLLAQPFLRHIPTEGELSLFYFNGELSHAIRKVPQAGDFRVQEEHGGELTPIEASPELLTAGNRVLQALEEAPLYARVDVVRANHGNDFWLIELEVIEPALYLRLAESAPQSFARAFVKRLG